MDKKKKRVFKLFDMNRDGKGVDKHEDLKPTFFNFFKIFFRRFGHLLRLNLMMVVQIIPIVVIICAWLLGPKSPTARNILFAPLYGVEQASAGVMTSVDLDMSSIQMGLPVFSPAMIITIICLVIVMAVTWGWQNIGATYVLRGLLRGDPVFIFSDFFYAIKKNLKQGLLLGLFDFLVSTILIVDFLFFYQRTGAYGFDVMYFAILLLILIWIIMRFYLYNLLITFDMKTFKIIKHAFIFTILGFGRNILAVLGAALLIILHIILAWILLPAGISIPIILPFFYIFAATAFMGTYAAYPVIDKYMIAPYVVESDEDFVYLKDRSDEGADDISDVADNESESIDASDKNKVVEDNKSQKTEKKNLGKAQNKSKKNKKSKNNKK